MLDILNKRHSVRSFLERKPSREQLRKILDAINSAPSAGGLKARDVFWAIESRSGAKYGERGRRLFSIQDATIAASFAWIQAAGQDWTRAGWAHSTNKPCEASFGKKSSRIGDQ